MKNKASSILKLIIFVLLIQNLTAQNTEVDTAWVSHYMSGQLPGKVGIVDMAIDAQDNIYITGYIKNVLSEEDYITAKYSPDSTEQWKVFYNGPGNSTDRAKSICLDQSGNVYVTGVSNSVNFNRDYATIKYDINGIEQWVARYDGPASEAYDKAHDIAIDDSGNVYVTGGSDSHSSEDYATVKYNNAGVEQWVMRYDGPESDGDDTATLIAIDNLNNIYVSGNSQGNGTNDDYATIKYSSSGVEKWVSRYNGPDDRTDKPKAIAMDDSGNVFITGSSNNSNYKWDYLTVKYDSAGVEQWNMRYVGPDQNNDEASAIAVDDSGYVYVTGNSQDNAQDDDFATIKYSPSGVEQWVARHDVSSAYANNSKVIALDNSGNIIVGGQDAGSAIIKYDSNGNDIWTTNFPGLQGVESLRLDSNGNIYIAGNSYYDYGLVKFNQSGIEQWSIIESGPGLSYEQPKISALDDSGNLYVAGFSRKPFTGDDFSLIKYNSDGIEQWVVTYNGPDSSSEYLTDMAIDDAGNIYLTGNSSVYGTDHDWATVKYNSDGIEQWVVRLDGAGNYYDGANALAVDDIGNVYVTGYTSPTASILDRDFTTVMYDAAGTQQWISHYNGSADYIDESVGITLDDSGNVYITGTSEETNNTDITTIKYNNLGVELWVVQHDGTNNSADIAVAIDIDNQNNIVVCGASRGINTNLDYVTIQYNSSGVEQWVNRYNGANDGWDSPTDLALNDSGDVFITGYAVGTQGSDDFATIKYDNAGTQQWVSVYDGPAYNWDQAASIAIGENGHVYVTGKSWGYNDNLDYATFNINPNGHREWIIRYDFKSDQAVDVVYGNGGQIYVTGYSEFESGSESRCTTFKFTHSTISGIEADANELPKIFLLKQNYPNPFNPTTTIAYDLPKAANVKIEVYNLLGKKVQTILDDYKSAGNHKFVFDSNNLASGVYFYRIQAGTFSNSKKMILLR